MDRTTFIILCIFASAVGCFYLAVERGFIIINHSGAQAASDNNLSTEKKSAKLFYWKHDKWSHEQVEVMSSSDRAQTIKYLIDAWLTLMDEEKIMKKKVSLQSAILSPNEQELFLSFDRNPFSKEASTFEKLMLLESILKTIRETGIKIQSVRFLVHHQEAHDYHLDFSHSWPSSGFIK